MAARSLAHSGYILCYRIPAAVLDHGEIYDHIYLIRAVFYGIGGLKGFGRSGHVAVGEAYDRAYFHPAVDIALCAGNVAGRDTYACAVIFYGLVAQSADLTGGAVRAQQSVIAFFKDRFYIHIILSLCFSCSYYILIACHIQVQTVNRF